MNAPHPTVARGAAAIVPSVLRIGAVSFLNTKPLVYGLEAADDLTFSLEVPSRLLDGLRARRYDVALLPVIDFQRLPGLRMLRSGGIGSDGQTLTVRIFSTVPIERIRRLACDGDSHSSIVLARVVLAEAYGIVPEQVPLETAAGAEAGGDSGAEAILLIGDKVVAQEPPASRYPHQLDLGSAWKDLTGLPFLFAAWMARSGVELGDLPARLAGAWRSGLAHVHEIVRTHAPPRGWPEDVALRYLTRNLTFEVTERHVEAVRRFHALAAKHGCIPSPARELVVEPD